MNVDLSVFVFRIFSGRVFRSFAANVGKPSVFRDRTRGCLTAEIERDRVVIVDGPVAVRTVLIAGTVS